MSASAITEPSATFYDAASRAEPGHVFPLGRHVLVCGDARDSDVVARAFAGVAAADSMVTDPPYGADLLEKWISQKRMMRNHKDMNARRDGCVNDAALTLKEVDDYRLFYNEFLRRAPLADPNTAYVFMSTAQLHNLRLALDDTGFHVSDYLVWLKHCLVPGRRDYHSQYETIVYCWRGRHKFHGRKHQPNVLQYKKNSRNRWHPCQKPLDLVERLVRDGSPEGGVVYDPFAGGGTTILACERAGRTCVAIELDPARCDLIRQRWEQRAEEGV